MLPAMNPAAATVEHAELAVHRPRLLRFALQHLRNRAQAEDAVQDTLLAALEGARRFAGESSVLTWLTGILRHKIVDFQRRAGREPLVEPDAVEEIAPPAFEPETALERKRFQEDLARALDLLPTNTARVFVLREVAGEGTESVCRIMNISAANCWVIVHRAKAALREELRHWQLNPETPSQGSP
jgi:RNA polymerase sigma-70 factor (ECF subfamily)